MASRTKNATRNIVAAMANKVVQLVFPFIIRSVIIQALGAEFLGLSSLFTSILQVLNLAEMGFSGAIVYSMYKPVAEKDTKTICAMMSLYKKVYRVIGVVVLMAGLLIMPFLAGMIDGGVPEGVNIYALYAIYLLNTVLTYFMFAYKSALVSAHQRNDIISNVYAATSLLQYVVQVVVLMATKDFYAYVAVQCVTTLLNNILVASIVSRKYPKYICVGEVTKKQRREIWKKVRGLMVQKVCAATRNSLDNIFISVMVGLAAVAMYSNYYAIMAAVIGIVGVLTSSIVSSVGNSIVTESEEKNYKDMNKFNFIYMWLSGWLTICLACLYQPLMRMWMGEEYMFPYEMVILFCVYFYVLKMGDIRSVYVEARGLWYENRFRAILETVLNVVLNFVLGYYFGVYGIMIGTLISLFLVNFVYGSTIIFKYYFRKESVMEYFMRHTMMAAVTLAVCAATFWACDLVELEGVAEIVAKGLICVVLPNLLYILVYRRSRVFADAADFAKRIIKRKV